MLYEVITNHHQVTVWYICKFYIIGAEPCFFVVCKSVFGLNHGIGCSGVTLGQKYIERNQTYHARYRWYFVGFERFEKNFARKYKYRFAVVNNIVNVLRIKIGKYWYYNCAIRNCG